MSVGVWDPKKVSVIYNGVTLVGFAKSGAIKAEKKEDNFNPYVGLLGDVTGAESYDDTGEITLKFAAGSSSVPYLRSEAKKRGDESWAACQIVNLNTNAATIGGTKCRITKFPADEIGSDVGELEFKIFVADYKEV